MAEGQPLSNINYSLQDYSTSIEYFDKRLRIAKECNDRVGQRRAHVNLGNSYLYLEDFDKCLYHYREAILIGEVLNDGVFVGQMNFVLGRVYNVKQQYQTSIDHHEKHLNLAQQFQDLKGQCRAYLVLSQLHEKINQFDKAKRYLGLYKAVSREIEKSSDGKNNSNKHLRAESISANQCEPVAPPSPRSNSVINSPTDDNPKKVKFNFIQHFTKKSPLIFRKQPATTTTTANEPDDLVDLVCRMQNSRFDDQRCEMNISHPQNNDRHSQLEDIFNAVDRLQQSRLDDQRTTLPQPSPLDEQFFDQLVKCQNSRMNDQRAVLLPLPLSNTPTSLRVTSSVSATTTPTANQTNSFFNESLSKTLPDEEFFSLLNRLQTRQSMINPRKK